jgi:dienelactone hydrolase
VLAQQYQSELEQLILMFGNHHQSEFVKLPTLVIYGAYDERFPASWIKTLAEKQKKNCLDLTIHEIQGGHFALLKKRKTVQERIGTWLEPVSNKISDAKQH